MRLSLYDFKIYELTDLDISSLIPSSSVSKNITAFSSLTFTFFRTKARFWNDIFTSKIKASIGAISILSKSVVSVEQSAKA